jgi:hypothetical protein
MSPRLNLKRTLVTTTFAVVALFALPAPARADITAFFGFSPTPATRPARGFSIGVGSTLIGGEFEWATTSETTAKSAPALKTYMFNGMLITPGHHAQLYLTAGWGRYRETLNSVQETGNTTNVGGGLKIRIAGPLKARIDYRVFSLRGTPLVKSPKRFYAGFTLGI